MLPTTQAATRSLLIQLAAHHRSTTTRLLKVKDMLLAPAIEEKRERDAKLLEAYNASSEALQQV